MVCLKLDLSKVGFLLAIWGLAQASVASSLNTDGCIKSLNTIYESEKKAKDDTKLRRYVLCPNTEYYVALNFDENGSPLDGQYPIPIGRPNIHVLCGEDGRSQNNCQLVRGLVHVGVVDEFGTGSVASNVLLQGLTFFRATSVNIIAMIGGDITVQDCVFKRNRNVASVYAVAPYNSLKVNNNRKLSHSSDKLLKNFLDVRRRTTEDSAYNMTKSGLHMKISNSVFSDNVLGASPGADTTAVIFTVGASMEISNSVIVGTTKDVQKAEDLSHLIYVENAAMMLRDNCFLGNNDEIAPVVSQSSVISATSNFNQRMTSFLPRSDCDFIAHNETGNGFVCQAAEASVCTATTTQNYRFPCVTYLDDIYFSEWDVLDSSVPRTYLLCPGTKFRVGSRHDDFGTPIGGSYPIILGRSNIRVLCGADGSITNNCSVENGVVQVAHFDEFKTGGVPIVNALVSGISFEGASAINALVSGSGDVRFQDCVFKGNSNVATVYVQGIQPKFRHRRSLRTVVSEVAGTWKNERLLSTSSKPNTLALQAQFDSCVFADNAVGSATNPISGLLSSHGANVSLTNNMIVDTVNHASKEHIGYYDVGYLIGNFDGDMTLQNNCFFDNEVSIAPVINQGVIRAELNAGYQAMVSADGASGQLRPAASNSRSGTPEKEAINVSNHDNATASAFPEESSENNTLGLAIDTVNARCEFIATIEKDDLGSMNPELVPFTCESFDADTCYRPDAPSDSPSVAPSISPQPTLMPTLSPTTYYVASGILPDSVGSSASGVGLSSAVLALSFFASASLFS